MSDRVNLSCSWGRTPVPSGDVPQVNYLFIEAEPIAQQQPVSLPLNFCLVLDHSGSMKGDKLANMKQATKRVIETLTPQDIVSLVIFDDTVDVILPATQATDKEALIAKVDTIEEVGGTAMSLGLEQGRKELRKHLSSNLLSHMLVLTDGQTWGDEDSCRHIAETLGKEGVTITALGLGAEWNEQLLDDLASLTNGNSDYIADPTTIDYYFQRTLETAHGTAAKDVRLLLRLVRDVSPRTVHRVAPSIANLGYEPIGEREVAVRMSDLVYEGTSSIVLDMLIPPRTTGTFRIAQAELHYVPVGQTNEEMMKQDILLDFVDDARQAKYTPRVMNIVEKVTAFKLQTRALEEAEVGNVSLATQKLRSAATRLLDLGELDLAAKAQQHADELEQGAQLSAETQKELRYATRRLTQNLDDDET